VSLQTRTDEADWQSKVCTKCIANGYDTDNPTMRTCAKCNRKRGTKWYSQKPPVTAASKRQSNVQARGAHRVAQQDCGECMKTHKNCFRCKAVVDFSTKGTAEQVKTWHQPGRYSKKQVLCDNCEVNGYTLDDIKTHTCRNPGCQEAGGVLAFDRKSVNNFNMGQKTPICKKCYQEAQKIKY
jgi:hypothetical protein